MFVFDANAHDPKQTGGKHPPGNKFPFAITSTEVKAVKDGGGKKYFEVTLTSPAGSIRNNYNLWNDSKTAVDIALGQLSALCHATGIFKVTFANDGKEGVDGKELIGGKGLMDIGFQAGQEPSAERPEGGYVEVKRIYDVNGNEPGKGQAQQASSGFGAQQPAQQPTPPVQQGWGNQPANPAPQTQANPAPSGGWQPGGNAPAEKPPWS